MTIEYLPINLPSRGQFYDGKCPDGTVSIRKLTAREEALLDSGGLAPHAKIAAMIAACTRLPEGLNVQDLLITDSLAIMLSLRTFTFGPEVRFTYRCPACGTANRTSVNAAKDFDETAPAEDTVEPYSLLLKDAGVTVGLRFLRLRDQEHLAKRAKKAAANDQDDEGVVHLLALALRIVTIDGVTAKLSEAEKLVGSLTMADSLRIRRADDKLEPGIDMATDQTCKRCKAENRIPVQMDAEFFRPLDL